MTLGKGKLLLGALDGVLVALMEFGGSLGMDFLIYRENSCQMSCWCH